MFSRLYLLKSYSRLCRDGWSARIIVGAIINRPRAVADRSYECYRKTLTNSSSFMREWYHNSLGNARMRTTGESPLLLPYCGCLKKTLAKRYKLCIIKGNMHYYAYL